MNPDQNTDQPPATTPTPQQPMYPQPRVPGTGLSLAGFIISLVSLIANFFTFGIAAVVGLVLSIVGRAQTKRAGHPSGLALAGIIISIVSAVITLVFFVIVTLTAIHIAGQCQELGPGTHNIGGAATITCGANGEFINAK